MCVNFTTKIGRRENYEYRNGQKCYLFGHSDLILNPFVGEVLSKVHLQVAINLDIEQHNLFYVCMPFLHLKVSDVQMGNFLCLVRY